MSAPRPALALYAHVQVSLIYVKVCALCIVHNKIYNSVVYSWALLDESRLS